MSLRHCLRIFQNESWCYQSKKWDQMRHSHELNMATVSKKSWHHDISCRRSVPGEQTPTINTLCCYRQPPIFLWRGIQGSAGRSGVWSVQMDPDFYRHSEGGSTKVKDMEKWERSKKNKKQKKHEIHEENHSVHGEKHYGKWGNQTGSMGFIVDSKC